MCFPLTLAEAFLIAFSVSADAFLIAFSYGLKQIKIPVYSVITIDCISSLVIGLALLAGTKVNEFIPTMWTTVSGSLILFLLGMIKLLFPGKEKNVDYDHSLSISMSEALLLSFLLSADGGAVGLSVSLQKVHKPAVLLFSFILNALFLISGSLLGQKSSKKLPHCAYLLEGFLLILLAIFNLF